MKKRLVTLLLASMTTAVLIGCSSSDLANISGSDDSTSEVSVIDEPDASNESESVDDSSSDSSITTIDDESTALISSYENSIAAIDLFDELFLNVPTEIDTTQLETLQNGASECTGDSFIGTWNRTFVTMGQEADITIEKADDNTCTINGWFDHYGNTGDIVDLTGYFLTENMMYAEDEEWDAVYLFKVTADSMEVKQIGFGCMGAGCSANGTYVTGDPEYLNAHDIEFAFTEDELDAIKELLEQNGLDYNEYFEDAILLGYFETSQGEATFDDGEVVSGRWFTSVAPHGCTRNLNLFISDDGKIYLESGFNYPDDTEFYTTDENVTTMPTNTSEDNQ